jgi:SAM-dependent methyltransferase
MERRGSGAAVQGGDHPGGYYAQARPEVAELVPPECHRVLDVGCGNGELGRLLKSRGHHVTGVELQPAAAERARRILDDAICCDVEGDGWPFAPESFDTILFADLLEHLVDPWRVLREAAPLLSPSGRVVASIPNVQNWDVLRRLVLGRWDYRDRGILDRGHLRFFTLRSIRRLFDHAGLDVIHVGHHYRRSWMRQAACFLSAGMVRPFLTRQYLVVGRKRA